MSRDSGLGFGGFLLGLGIGWVVFRYFEVTSNLFAILMILLGVVIIGSSLLKSQLPRFEYGDLFGGLIGGLILSLIFTSGFSIFTDIFDGGSIGDYRYQDTQSFSGGITASTISLKIDNFNGPIRVSTWSKDEYSVELDIKARRENDLDDLKIDFDVMETQMTQGITLGYDIPSTSYSRYSIAVDVFLPAEATINLNLASSNGGITLSDIESERITLKTSNGGIELNNVYTEVIDGETSNGAITGAIEAPDTSLSTSNGAIDLELLSTSSGNYILSTSNARINLELSSSTEVGYDLDLSTSNANIDIDIPNLDYTTNQRTRKEAKTKNFETKSIKIKIDAETSNSSISVQT
jgi:hypothetical protein